jgi:hypothetical protein
MKLYTCHIYGESIIYYFSNDVDILKCPYVWVNERKGMFSVCGSSIFLDHYIPKRKESKNPSKVFSLLRDLNKIVETLSIKEKIKLCLLKPDGKDFGINTIYLSNESYSRFTPKTKGAKNEKSKG